MKLTVDETGSEAEKATTALGIDHAMQSVMLTAASLLIVVLNGASHSVKPHGHRVQPRHYKQQRCRHAGSKRSSNAVMKTKTCLFTCIQPGEIACGAAVSPDRTLLCDLEEFCDGLQLHGSRPLASKRDE
jgi:hypothetical protein